MSVPENTADFPSDTMPLTIHVTNGEGFAWNDTIKGVVTLHAHPTKTQTFSTVSVGIVEQTVDGFLSPVGFAGSRDSLNTFPIAGFSSEMNPMPMEPTSFSLEEVIIARDVVVNAAETNKEFPFLLPVPSGLSLEALCFVTAQALSTDGVDTDLHEAVPFTLLPPRCIQAIQDSVRRFGNFELIELSESGRDHGTSHEFTIDYVAQDALTEQLDGIKFELVADATAVRGIAIINPQEHSFADHLRSFVHADRIRVPVEFDRIELENAISSGFPAGSVDQRLHELLDPFLVKIDR